MFGRKKIFKLKITGRAGLIYEEGDRLMRIDSEMLTGPKYDMVIYGGSIQSWEPPHENELLSAEDVDRIKSNIRTDLAKHKIKADWD